nr:hypothetical protein [Curtobacterium sp. UNCCL17]
MRRLPQVPEEDPGQARRTGVPVRRPRDQHDARVVAGGTVVARWPHHAPGERAEGAGHAVVRRPDVDTGTPEVVDHTLVRRTAHGSDQGGLDRVRHGGHRADVVAVEVRQDEQVDPGDPEQAQARPEPFLVVAGVHQRDGVVATEQHGVPLPDVFRARSVCVAPRAAASGHLAR